MKQLIERVGAERQRLVTHPVYRSITSVADLHVFMEHHVFAVWDFMCLLKSLQYHLSSVRMPWVPKGDPNLRRLVNDIVLSEETDEDGEGGFCSHFELYLRAMRQVGADTSSITDFVRRMWQKEPVQQSLRACYAPPAAQRFVNQTFATVNSNQPHRVAAGLTFGREDVVPEMFLRIVENLQQEHTLRFDRFVYYLNRHIAVDSESHGPMAFDMVAAICGENERLWKEAEDAALFGIASRIQLWDGVCEETRRRRQKNPPVLAAADWFETPGVTSRHAWQRP
jgi:hypothetical protein